MQLSFRLFFLCIALQWQVYSQFNVGAFSGYNFGSRLNVGAFTEYSVEEFWPATLKVNYAYGIPYSKQGTEDPVMKQTGSDVEVEFFARTRETFRHHSVFFEYKQYTGEDADCSLGGPYFKSIIGLTFSKVIRNWEFPEDEFLINKYELFTIRQTSLNFGVAWGYDLRLTEKFFLAGDISAMLPFIKLTSNSKEYDGFPDFSLGIQLSAKYRLF